MKAIVEIFEGSGILVTQAKVSFQTTGLATLKIKDQRECLVKVLETIKSAKYTIKDVQAIQEPDTREDICNINYYIQRRIQNNAISKIMNLGRPNISLIVSSLLQHFQPTTASVKRNFSMLPELLPINRTCRVENVKQYIIVHFTSCTW